jgi:hypothetical protein
VQPLRKLGSVPALVVTCSALLLLCVVLAGGSQEILGALPAILVLLGPVFGRYPGDRVIFRLRRSRRTRRPATAVAGPPRSRVLDLPGRIVFLAASRSLRGPPALLSVSS